MCLTVGTISYFPRKNSLDTKKKLLIAVEFSLAIFLFIIPGGPGRPALEDGPDPDELANFHRNGWPTMSSALELFNYYVIDQVAGTSDDKPFGGDETYATASEEKEDDRSGYSSNSDKTEDETEEALPRPGHRHDAQKDAEQDPEAANENDEEGQPDQELGSQEDQVPATNTGVNIAPQAENQTISTQENAPVLVQLLASDVEGDGLAFNISDSPSNGTLSFFSATNGSAVYTPNTGFVGSDSFEFKVIDEGGKSDNARVYIQVIEADPNGDTDEDGSYIVTEDEPAPVQVGDNGNGNDSSNEVIVQPQHGTVSEGSNNTIVYLPDPNYTGPDSFVVNTTDGSGSTITHNVTVNVTPVNDPPVAPNITLATAEDTPVILTLVNGTSDVDGDVTSLIITTFPTHGTISTSPDNATITYTPNQDFQGEDSFTYTIGDVAYNSSGTVDITITPVNDNPALIEGANLEYSTTEDSPVQINILSYVNDVDGDALTVSELSQASNGIVVLNFDGTVIYTPSPGFVGQDSFGFTVTDSNGATVSGTLNITVLPVNDIPPNSDVENPVNDTQLDDVVVIPGNIMPTTEDMIVILDEDSLATIQLNATDPDGDPITFSIVSQPAHGTLVMIDSSAGIVQYLPFANYYGPDSFTYLVNDGMTQSEIATVDLAITGINDLPVAYDDSVYGYEGNATIIDVLAGDIDVDGDLLTIKIAQGPSHGIVIVNGDGTVTYTPDPDFDGTDSFNYIVSDGNGGSASATVTITLGSVNDAPVVASEAVVMDEDQSAEIELYAADEEGAILDLEIVVPPLHGSVEIIPGDNFVVRYIPQTDYHGADGFAFRVTDGLAYSNVASVDIVVNSVNDAPIANSDSFAIAQDMPLAGNVLVNDVDVDGDILSASIGQGVTSFGTIVMNPDGSFVFTPNENFNGVASFQYQISDGNGGIASGTVIITILQVNDSPVARDDVGHTIRNHAVLLEVLSNDIDSDNDVLSVVSVGTASSGTVKITADAKAVIYEPDRGFTGEDRFTYTVTDGQNSAYAAVDVKVHKKHHEDNNHNDDHGSEDDENDDNKAGANDGDEDDCDQKGKSDYDDEKERNKHKHDNDDSDNGGAGNHDHDDKGDDENEKNEHDHDDEENDDNDRDDEGDDKEGNKQHGDNDNDHGEKDDRQDDRDDDHDDEEEDEDD